MKVFYSDQSLDVVDWKVPSLFLAGPTPRNKNVPSWRPEALTILESLNYNGQVLIPERGDWKSLIEYTHQVEWEDTGLLNACRIVFWVPRNMETMPALTTNVEFGRFYQDLRMIYGRPDDADHIRYLDW